MERKIVIETKQGQIINPEDFEPIYICNESGQMTKKCVADGYYCCKYCTYEDYLNRHIISYSRKETDPYIFIRSLIGKKAVYQVEIPNEVSYEDFEYVFLDQFPRAHQLDTCLSENEYDIESIGKNAAGKKIAQFKLTICIGDAMSSNCQSDPVAGLIDEMSYMSLEKDIFPSMNNCVVCNQFPQNKKRLCTLCYKKHLYMTEDEKDELHFVFMEEARQNEKKSLKSRNKFLKEPLPKTFEMQLGFDQGYFVFDFIFQEYQD